MLASNVMFGQGPLAPWQMFSMGIIGFLAGILFRKGLLMRTRGALCIFGALCAILIYGGIMNPASALTANRELTGGILLSSCLLYTSRCVSETDSIQLHHFHLLRNHSG